MPAFVARVLATELVKLQMSMVVLQPQPLR
jgi:hypothetical protein